MDGGFSDNLPLLNENTITVSPFAGENDICPSDESFNLMLINLSNTSIAVSPANLYRIVRILFPPHPEILARMTQQGEWRLKVHLQSVDNAGLVGTQGHLSLNSL